MLVGIILRDSTKYYLLNKEICQKVFKYGFVPIGLCPSDNIELYLNLCSGFIMQGGDEITDFDYEIIKKVKEKNKPLLGICLGMQTMANTNLGHISGHHSFSKYVHYIEIMPYTKLYEIIKQNKILVNSRHKDCVIKTDLKICAYASDGTIEAIEDGSKKFFIGVQWHPESLNDKNSHLLFKSFFDACRG